MRPFRLALIAGACLLALSACQKPESDQAFGQRVRAYLLGHPEILQEMMVKLQAKQDADAAKRQGAALAQNRKSLEHDPRDFVANPGGKVTLTEFYDYRCPHCVSAAPGVVALIHDHPNVRVVFKEMPIFGLPSQRAAEGAIAVKQAGGDVLGLYGDLMAARPLDEAALGRILKARGVNPARLDDPIFKAKAEAQLEAVHNLAAAIGIDGTPAFVVGDTLIPGDDLDAVRAALRQAGA